ncbi:UDP-2,3-diacylglucosamine diphosphatase [Thiorhodovibrio winogradskyi]|nr:UDP-2,3-diacylglucosamine diphosphatase [Thiorhodovibrio winogradskyi]
MTESAATVDQISDQTPTPRTQRLFISDLHLDPDQPEILAHFLAFLRGRARSAGELYILGDLFDAWIGDDALDDPQVASDYRRVTASLRALHEAGTRCWLMQGNRDFLLGRRFARASGCRLLGDPSLVRMADQSILLMHGDLLCTDDIAYQRFRRRVRNPLIQKLFLLRPRQQRLRIAADYRGRSRAATAAKQRAIMDVNPRAVIKYIARYQADRLIHGHTHRPGDHPVSLAQHQCLRQVLADWRYADGKVQAELLVEEKGRWWREPVRSAV